jgi:hypothetical protein
MLTLSQERALQRKIVHRGWTRLDREDAWTKAAEENVVDSNIQSVWADVKKKNKESTIQASSASFFLP